MYGSGLYHLAIGGRAFKYGSGLYHLAIGGRALNYGAGCITWREGFEVWSWAVSLGYRREGLKYGAGLHHLAIGGRNLSSVPPSACCN